MTDVTARAGRIDRPRRRPRGAHAAGVVILAQFLLRAASAAGALVVGSYFVDLAHHGVPISSLALGALSALAYLAELILAPLSGSLSDLKGRRLFLVVAPLVAAVGIVLTPGASVFSATPPLAMVVAIVGVSRLIDGTSAAMATPATLGLLADSTDEDRHRRGRLNSMYELSSSGGIAVGAVIGPALYAVTGLWAFTVLAGIYAIAGILVATFTRTDRPKADTTPVTLRRRLKIFSNRRLLAFLPSWIAVNAILGTWVTSQITYVLAGDRTLPGQRFTGSLAHHPAWLSPILGGYVLLFSLFIIGWSFIVGRLPTLPTLTVTISGAVLTSTGLIMANHGIALTVAIPIVVVGVFLEAGFTPAALTHLSDISADFRPNRGLIMGVYSVVLGVGYLLGNLLGGVFAQWLAFDGLGLLTILLAIIALTTIPGMMLAERRHGRTREAPPRDSLTSTPVSARPNDDATQ